MNEEMLRRWVRKDLPSSERRAVGRWIVRCTDPRLGPLLHAMIVEHADSARDSALAARAEPWGRLVRLWKDLLAQGGAYVSVGDDAGLTLASVGGAAQAPRLALSVDEQGARVTLRQDLNEAQAETAVYATDDAGHATLLRAPAPVAGDVTLDIPVSPGDRLTIWAVCAPTLPRDPDPLAELVQASGAAGARTWAVRLAPRE